MENRRVPGHRQSHWRTQEIDHGRWERNISVPLTRGHSDIRESRNQNGCLVASRGFGPRQVGWRPGANHAEPRLPILRVAIEQWARFGVFFDPGGGAGYLRSEEHTSELQSLRH